MKFTSVNNPPINLNLLSHVSLMPHYQARLDTASAVNGGDPAWRSRKAAEARQLLTLEQVVPHRIKILDLDLYASLRTVFMLRAPVPCHPDAQQQLVIASDAMLGLDYPIEAVRAPSQGYRFITILHPRPVWHANVALPSQSLCLGAKLPAGIRVRSLVMMAYGALTGQTMQQVDPQDGAGLLNLEAALWWQQNLHRLPLSSEPFLSQPRVSSGETQ